MITNKYFCIRFKLPNWERKKTKNSKKRSLAKDQSPNAAKSSKNVKANDVAVARIPGLPESQPPDCIFFKLI